MIGDRVMVVVCDVVFIWAFRLDYVIHLSWTKHTRSSTMSKRTLGRFVAQSELQMRRRQMIQPVPCWEYKWVAISSNSTVRLRQWVKTDKKQVINLTLYVYSIVAMDFRGLSPPMSDSLANVGVQLPVYPLPPYASLSEPKIYMNCYRSSPMTKIRHKQRFLLCQMSQNQSRVTKKKRTRK